MISLIINIIIHLLISLYILMMNDELAILNKIIKNKEINENKNVLDIFECGAPGRAGPSLGEGGGGVGSDGEGGGGGGSGWGVGLAGFGSTNRDDQVVRSVGWTD